MTDKQKAYLSLHFCVLIWGFTAILGKLIQVSALPLVWWRVVLCVGLLVWLVPKEQRRLVEGRQAFRLLLIGALIGIHWICFYGAVKLSNASVAVASMAMTTLFASFTEPIILRRKIIWYELGLGILILPGMVLMVGDLDWGMKTGFGVGVLGALIAAVFTAYNKREIDLRPPPPLAMSLFELSGAVLITSVALVLVRPTWALVWPVGTDWVWLVVLAWVCTLLPHYLTLKAMRHISAFATNLTINLEPVYGVLLAMFIFQENKSLPPNFYVGVVIVLLAVFSHPFLKRWLDRPLPRE
jgi:drug/metabolite transporter (DMT)-like permease